MKNKFYFAYQALAKKNEEKNYNVDLKFAEEILQIHNKYRKNHEVEPLILNKDLCQVAQEWAEVLAKENKMYHRPNGIYGENIYYYWTSVPNYKVQAKNVVSSWYDEIKTYKFGENFMQEGCGHFTQVIWKNSKEIGTGYAVSKEGTQFVVSNYNPPGNWQRQFAENVPPPLQTSSIIIHVKPCQGKRKKQRSRLVKLCAKWCCTICI